MYVFGGLVVFLAKVKSSLIENMKCEIDTQLWIRGGSLISSRMNVFTEKTLSHVSTPPLIRMAR